MHLILGNHQLWVLIIGAIVPAFTYVLNHYAPWVKEPVKAVAVIVVSAIAAGLYTALATPSFGLNSTTLQFVVTAIVAALSAHFLFWHPSGIATKLGAGSNHQDHV